ncbi:MAG TPA: HipA domain-containing protein, partial [Saprospiraceae bacterium]|nr:HipA domain-containing protein [Saprospiraceae bacterium]
VQSQIAVTGVQPKLSLDLEPLNTEKGTKRFTIVGLWGGYILKPPSEHYQQLPEVEDLTMHLAQLAKIEVVPHSLVRLQSGNLAYITKRIDRNKKSKLHLEDMCQLTERLTEDKYRGAHEQVARAIQQYSTRPGLDVINFFEQVVFSFLTGNADMHLKNFSLINRPGLGYILSPAYDLVATALVNPADIEELALNLNGKKRKLKRQDFTHTFRSLQLEERQGENIFLKLNRAMPIWMEFIDTSFISEKKKNEYKTLINERWERLRKLT